MEIDVVFRWPDLLPEEAEGRVAVVIDVLRATSMIAALLAAGAREVWPVKEVDEARRLASELGGALLAGERGGLPPAGFDMGNSPREVDAKVQGRPVVLTTTNGTSAIQRAARAEALVTAAFVNAGAVVASLLATAPERVLIVCAGTEGAFSLDDALCAGGIVAGLASGAGEAPGCSGVRLTDSAVAARLLYESQQDKLAAAMRSCRHGRRLESLGMGGDIDWAARESVIDLVPVRAPGQGQSRLVAAQAGARLSA
ncbi:MAG: 2-phosphosulfolactate phosphatase [Limnochordia bacterium]|nr:2-phosphosulfolactate phosphatase [Bacillota bacterium]